jgi:hypothetical protein
VLRAPGQPGVVRSRGPGLRERVGLVVGALACLATSAPPSFPHHPFFVNRTSDSVELRVTWLLRKVDCATTPEKLADTLDPSDLDDPRTLEIGPGKWRCSRGKRTARSRRSASATSKARTSIWMTRIASLRSSSRATQRRL